MSTVTGTAGAARPGGPRNFAFLLIPNFSMMPFTAAIEPLRVANRMEGQALYRWCTLSKTGAAVKASNGALVHADAALAQCGPVDAIVVCAGIDAYAYLDNDVAAQLRRFSRRDCLIGSVCSGSIVLADAGLLEGRRCTGHWEDLDMLAENYPELDVTRSMFEIDGSRFTCSGGTAPLDLMLHLIASDFGRDLAALVADQMLHHLARPSGGPQRLALPERTGARHPRLLEVIAAMEANLENPIGLTALASDAGLSKRQLERLFAAQLGTRPGAYYSDLRLQRARYLVRQTGLSMLEVAVATGFSSATHFAKAYRAAFGLPPSRDRAASRRNVQGDFRP